MARTRKDNIRAVYRRLCLTLRLIPQMEAYIDTKEAHCMNQQPAPPCRSIFRKTPTKEKYTTLWIALIDQIERSKKILAGVK